MYLYIYICICTYIYHLTETSHKTCWVTHVFHTIPSTRPSRSPHYLSQACIATAKIQNTSSLRPQQSSELNENDGVCFSIKSLWFSKYVWNITRKMVNYHHHHHHHHHHHLLLLLLLLLLLTGLGVIRVSYARAHANSWNKVIFWRIPLLDSRLHCTSCHHNSHVRFHPGSQKATCTKTLRCTNIAFEITQVQ